mgnify:FL=1|jgi:pseudaminic acid synthase
MKLMEYVRNNKTYIIAEMSGNHGGNLENALELVRKAKEAGADCLKTQAYSAESLTLDCDNEYFTVTTGLWAGKKRFDVYKEAATPWEWQIEIKKECERAGIDFLSTPFDKKGVDFLDELGVEAYKISSFELVDIPLIRYVAKKNKPVILSCGLGSKDEIEAAVKTIRQENDKELILLKCCSEYPAPYSDINMLTMVDMKNSFNVPVGFSDHTMGYMASVVAVSMGASVIEKHFCLDRNIKTPDSDFSSEPEEFREMVEAIRTAEQIRGIVTYTRTKGEEDRVMTRRSLFAVEDICSGEKFTENNVRSIRPANGISPIYYDELVGKIAKRNIKRGEPITYEDLG